MAEVGLNTLWKATSVGSGSMTLTQVEEPIPPASQSYLNVMAPAYGVVGDGVADDWAALNAARDAAVAAGKLLYFPKGVYGISDRWYFADGGDAWFEPGATLKLLDATVSGGAVSGPYPAQTKPINVHNLTIDCNNLPGENGIGFGHVVGAAFHNLTIRNCRHNPNDYKFGGKGLQFEGTTALNCQVFGLTLENCSIGIDIGAHGGHQSTHIGIFNVVMKNVDVPIHFNDTANGTFVDSYDSTEVLIDGVQCRNCGRISWPGGTPLGAGIIAANRGHKVTVRNLQVVNDAGGYGSAAYGKIGAVVRGTMRGLVLENVLVVADAVAIVDTDPLQMQIAQGEGANYILADNIRHYGDLDYVYKATSHTNIGAGKLVVEIGSASATLSGIVNAGAGTSSSTMLEVIDRDSGFKTTGFDTLKSHFDKGNTLAATLGGDLTESFGSWTPTDASGAGLALIDSTGRWVRHGRVMTIWGHVQYPTNSNTTIAAIGGLPLTIPNNLAARAGATLSIATGTAQRIYPVPMTNTAAILNAASAGMTNAQCSGSILAFKIEVPLV